VGDGEERESLSEQIRRLGLEGTVELVGSRTAPQVAELMRSSDVFVFPSIRESGGLVVVEAMASGLACVVADHGGPGISVTHETGFKIPVGNPEELALRFREKLEQLVLDPELRIRMGESAAKRMRELYTWDSRGRIIHEIYRWVLGQRPDKPDVNRAVAEPMSAPELGS
jgi:glycosyltransferase involved in cell wall biosynthesis